MYEQVDNVGTAFIFLGSQRVAAIDTNNGAPIFYHGDHLGSTNVMTSSTGAVAELLEYDPYGKIQRHDGASGSARLAKQQFTGKKLDDETGLYYFGARYYDPLLGRFITPDTIVQNPSDPQTLNRYSYCGNNPINRIDPDGHKWFKKFMKRYGNFISPFLRAAVTGDWKGYANIMIATATSFVVSGFNPIVAAATYATESVLATPQGKQLTEGLATQVFDDALGMRPKTAYIWSAVTVRIAATLTFEKMFASATVAKPVDIKKELLSDGELKTLGDSGQFAGDESMFGPSLKTKGSFEVDHVKGLTQDGKLVGSFQKRVLDVPGLKQLGAQHSSVNVLNVTSNFKVNPLSYATFGVCHQAANLSLLNGGISSTIFNIGPSWDMYVTTAVYGNYGGQLGYRVLSGVNANDNYKK